MGWPRCWAEFSILNTRRLAGRRSDRAANYFLGVITRRTLFQFRRRRAIEHIPLRPLQHVARIGFDGERAALARDLGDLLDAAEHVLQGIAGPDLVNVEQFSAKLPRIG